LWKESINEEEEEEEGVDDTLGVELVATVVVVEASCAESITIGVLVIVILQTKGPRFKVNREIERERRGERENEIKK
jgi:hypothetical protein